MQVTSQLRALKSAFSLLRDRSLVSVEGADAFKFLQGLTTNDLSLLHQRPITSIYTNMLNVQGRVAFDVLISLPPGTPTTTTSTQPPHPPHPPHTYFLDCASSVVGDIQQYFQKYKLRNKIKVTDVSNKYHVWSVFGQGVTCTPHLTTPTTTPSELALDPTEGRSLTSSLAVTGGIAEWWGKRDGVLVADPRYEKLGARMILPLTETPNLPPLFTEVSDSVYNIYRMQWGIPQGPEELQRDSALPLECNTELLNGVHFHKGCYIGQELVARTHYSGLIRKRLFPFVMIAASPSSDVAVPQQDFECGEFLFPKIVIDNLAATIPPTGSTLSVGDIKALQGSVTASRDRKTGKVVSGSHNVGLAMIRLESLNLNNLIDTTIIDEKSGGQVKLLNPCWWANEVEKIKKLLTKM